MHPDLQRYFNRVWPLFLPWLVWNLVRVARWHAHTRRYALMAVHRFGNIQLTFVADVPPLDDLYTYEVPRLAAWEHPALRSDVPACVGVQSDEVHNDPDKSGIVMSGHAIVRHDHGLHARGPP
jgi:hypothetical protein